MIQLRGVRADDSEMMRNWRNRPEIATYMYTDHHITREEHDNWFRNMQSDATVKYWIIVVDGEDVGIVNLYNMDHGHKRCSWAFYVASPNVRGKGVGSFVEYSVMRYVFLDLGFNKLCCEVLASNPAVIEMHKRFGFAEEGSFRQHIFKQDTYHDVVALAILRADWAEKSTEIENRMREKDLI